MRYYRALKPGDPNSALTPREKEVCEMMNNGRSPGLIARDLDIAVRTVETHIDHAKKKLGARDSWELLYIYRTCGGVTDAEISRDMAFCESEIKHILGRYRMTLTVSKGSIYLNYARMRLKDKGDHFKRRIR